MEDIIAQLKAIRIPFESEQDNEGLWHSWAVEALGLWGKGRELEDSIDDMILMWRKGLEILAEDHMQPLPDTMAFYAKVLVSSDEELRKCLSGEICAISR